MSPYRMRLSKRNRLQQDSDILINQIRTLSKQRIGEKIAELTRAEYDLLIKSLCENFS
jgi:mRNA interferase MazF